MWCQNTGDSGLSATLYTEQVLPGAIGALQYGRKTTICRVRSVPDKDLGKISKKKEGLMHAGKNVKV